MEAVADSGFIISLTISTDIKHKICLQVYQQHRRIYLPQSTLAEVGYLLTKAGGNLLAASFLRGLPKSKFQPIAIEAEDFARTADILEKYADARLDFVDATIVAVAERLNISRILTIDRRDFALVRPTHTSYFELLP